MIPPGLAVNLTVTADLWRMIDKDTLQAIANGFDGFISFGR